MYAGVVAEVAVEKEGVFAQGEGKGKGKGGRTISELVLGRCLGCWVGFCSCVAMSLAVGLMFSGRHVGKERGRRGTGGKTYSGP